MRSLTCLGRLEFFDRSLPKEKRRAGRVRQLLTQAISFSFCCRGGIRLLIVPGHKEMMPASGSRVKPLEVTLTLTVGLEAGFVEDGLLCLFDHSALEAGVVDQ